MARMKPLPIEDCEDPELRKIMEHFVNTLGFVPNSLLTMQRVPAIAKATVQFNKAVFAADSEVDLGLKRLLANAASAAVGCQYCRAHTAVSATRHGITDEKVEAIRISDQPAIRRAGARGDRICDGCSFGSESRYRQAVRST